MYIPRCERTMDQYLHEVSQYTLLTPDDEVTLARRIKEGDQEAFQALVCANLRFVVTVAKKYQGQGLHLADLINEGNCGLIKAAHRFDETRGFRFISYAVWWIRQAIFQALAEHSRVVRLPINHILAINKLKKASVRLSQTHERPPSLEELAEELDLNVEKVHEEMMYAKESYSMDAPFFNEEQDKLLDVLPDEKTKAPDALLMKESQTNHIEYALNRLQPREAEITRLYFGIGRSHPLTLDEVGARFGLTRERVRQIKENALRKLRYKHRHEGLHLHVS